MRSLIRRKSHRQAAHDPAPSRWSYRIQRLWLTPVFRAVLRVGVPAFAVVAVGGVYISDPANVQRLQDSVSEIRRSIEERPEFRVNLLSVSGASPVLTEEIRATLGMHFPVSSFDLDLVALRLRVQAIRAVADAELRIRSGGELAIAVTERTPSMIWQAREGLWLIDDTGERVTPLLARPDLADLPIVAGDRANEVAEEALELFVTAQPLGDRLRGLVRVGERRWDVILTDGTRILLPAADPATVLDRVLAQDDAQELLDRDITRVDLRDPTRTVLQLTPEALAELRRMRNTDVTGDSQG